MTHEEFERNAKHGMEMVNKRWELYYRNRRANAYRADVARKHERRERVTMFIGELAVMGILIAQIVGVR